MMSAINAQLSFVDHTRIGHHCMSHADCDPPYIVCQDDYALGGNPTCQHKPLFPLTKMEVIGTIIIVTMGMAATAGGLGGGSLFCPLIMIFFFMDAHRAIPLSNSLTFFNSVVKYSMSLHEKHPFIPHKPIIDFNLAIMFNPMIMLGSFIGVIFSILLPGVVTMGILAVTLVMALVESSISTVKKYRQENEKIAQDAEENQQELLALGMGNKKNDGDDDVEIPDVES